MPLVDVKAKMILNQEDFMSRIFPKKFKVAVDAVKIFELIRKGEVTIYSYDNICKKLGISLNEYYYISVHKWI